MKQPERVDAALLWDMLDSAQAITQFVGPTKYEEYLKNLLLQAAVERKIEIIGEAARELSSPFREANPQIPWTKIIAQRHVLAHEYGEIDQMLLWTVIQDHIPKLIKDLQALIPQSPTN